MIYGDLINIGVFGCIKVIGQVHVSIIGAYLAPWSSRASWTLTKIQRVANSLRSRLQDGHHFKIKSEPVLLDGTRPNLAIYQIRHYKFSNLTLNKLVLWPGFWGDRETVRRRPNAQSSPSPSLRTLHSYQRHRTMRFRIGISCRGEIPVNRLLQRQLRYLATPYGVLLHSMLLRNCCDVWRRPLATPFCVSGCCETVVTYGDALLLFEMWGCERDLPTHPFYIDSRQYGRSFLVLFP